LQAKSVHGKGSEFVLSLLLRPALQAVASPNVPLAEGAAQTTFEGLKVLLVEDNAVNQKVAKSLLVRMGCGVDTASNGIEAIATLQQKAFDVVFMDCQMPLMDGLDATRRIRAGQAGERSQGVWILAMTAHAMPGDRERCIEAGMNDYLTKPVRMSDLQQALQRLLTRQESAAA
jgi:CheY-like chemotaxis protein